MSFIRSWTRHTTPPQWPCFFTEDALLVEPGGMFSGRQAKQIYVNSCHPQ